MKREIHMKTFGLILLLAAAAALMCGCANLGVQPWQRGVLAKPEMAFDCEPVPFATDDHIYFSKEAVSGGRDFAGGGCGCN
jgi:hypothetical protein